MYDLIIVGSGPAGLGSALYAARAKMNFLVVEKAGYSGGQIINTSEVDNYLALPGIDGVELAMKFREHAEKMGATIIDDGVASIEEKEDYYNLNMTSGKSMETKTVIVATGANYRNIGAIGEEKFKGRGVSYCATCDGAFYKGKTVAVVGGGDVALGDAIYLSKLADKVYLIHRRDTLRGAKHLQEKVFSNPKIEFIPDSIVEEIQGENNVSDIIIKNIKDNSVRTLEVNGIFVAVGMNPITDFLGDFLELDEKGYIKADESGITSKKGIFAAGDVRTKQLRQVITAVADGANCVASVEKYLN